MNTKQRVTLLKQQNGFIPCSKNCGSCCFYQADENKDASTVGDLCVVDPELPFRTSPDSTCQKWCF